MRQNIFVLFGLASIVAGCNCSKAGYIYPQSGDNQSAVAGQALANPLVVLVADTGGKPLAKVTVNWTATNGTLTTPTSTTDSSGHASNTATLGSTAGASTFVATVAGVSGSVTFTANAEHGFVYTPSTPGAAKIQLVQNAGSTPDVEILDVVATSALSGFTVAMNLPVDATKVQMHSTPITPGTALPPGNSPVAAGAVLPISGPNTGVIVSGQSQKAAGSGAVNPVQNASISSGAVLYSIQIDRIPGAAAGVVFDGAALPATFKAGLRDLSGTDVVTSSQFSIGKLELR